MDGITIGIFALGGLLFVPAYVFMLKACWDLWTTRKESSDADGK